MKSPLLQKIRAHVRQADYRPQNKSEIARSLGIPSKDRAAFREALVALERQGEIIAGKKGRYYRPGKSKSGDLLSGRIEFSPDRKRRSAFFVPEDPESHPLFRKMDRPRLFVPGRFTETALHGDAVEIQLVRSGPPKWHQYSKKHRAKASRSRASQARARGKGEKGAFSDPDEWQARVRTIVKRSGNPIVGTFHGKGSRVSVSPEDGRLPATFQLMSVLPEARPGDVVAAKFLDWTDPHYLPMAEMTEVIGRPNAPRVDMLKVIHRHGLPLEFPEAVLAEAEAIDEVISEEELLRRDDWREREVFTIDPEDAKDFDDAICVTEGDDGIWELAVHIADVSHYVKPGSALDREAKRRGNSVYLADRVIPMLPEKLSNGVCSLKPEVERLTHAAILRFDPEGKLIGSRFVSAVIRSHRRYTYEEAHAIMMLEEEQIAGIEDAKERQLAEHLKRAWRLASLLRKKRFQRGSLDLDFPEVRVVLDDDGRAVGVKKSIYDESHQLIEEFMLAANESVAYETKNAPAPSVYRVHEDPDPGKLEEFADLARSFGHRVGDVTHRPELQKLLVAVRGTFEEHSVKIALLKSLRRAAYSKDPLGHYGLAKVNYTHFTSPIRRYADLVVHRVLRRIMSKRNEPTAPEQPDRTPKMQEIKDFADHISRTERVAAEAEMETQRIKMIEYLERVCNEEEDAVFEATIYEVRPIGAFLELNELLVKGLIRKDDLAPRDEYYFDRVRQQFTSRQHGPPLAVGQVLKVRLYRVNRDRGFLDFVPA
ncbi:MAG: VacB/RNase II family 3'-5' exoribonuclease [Verrucomicrobiota bacterium]